MREKLKTRAARKWGDWMIVPIERWEAIERVLAALNEVKSLTPPKRKPTKKPR